MFWYIYIVIGLAIGWMSNSKPSIVVQQYMRLFETFFYGPMKMYLGYQIYIHKWMSEFFAAILMVGGAITTSQNFKDYIQQKKSITKDLKELTFP